MTSTFTPNLGLEVPGHGDYAATGWDTPMDASLNTLDTAYGGLASITISGGTHQLTKAEASNPVIYLGGTLSSDQYLYFPPIAGRRIIVPAMNLNGFTLYVRGNNGTDGNGIYFWTNTGFPFGIVVLPWRVHWDYGAVLPGTVADFPTGFCGNGWLPCDGRWVVQSLHDILFNYVIGGTWGISGPYFKLPDYRGTVTAMADQIGTVPPSGPYASNAGNRGILNSWGITTYAGESAHTLSYNEMPSHNHSDYGHGHSIADPGHQHNVHHPGSFGYGIGATPQINPFVNVGGSDYPTDVRGTGIGIYAGYANISYAGASWGHNNVQPTTCTMKMIKW